MYQSAGFLVLLLGIGAAGILFLGLLLSIILFYTKKTAIEVIAWICGGASFILYLTCLHLGVSREFEWFALYLLTVLLTFFLLLQYRSKLAQGNTLKVVLILRTVLILLTFATICKEAINLLSTSNLLKPGTGNQVSIFYTVQSIIFWCILTSSCIWYLYKINPPLLRSEIFRIAILFNWPVFLLVVTLGMLFFFVEYTNLNSGVTVSMLFNKKFLLSQLSFLIFGCAISAIIAASIYHYFKTARNRTITT